MPRARIGRIASRLRRAARATFWVELVDDVEGDRRNALASEKDRVVKVTKTLVDDLSDDELAYVLSHEVAHLEMGHGQKVIDWVTEAGEQLKEDVIERGRRLRDAGHGFCSRALSQAVWCALGLGGIYVVSRLRHQEHEIEADKRALEIAALAGFDPKASVSALRKINGGWLPERGLLKNLSSEHPAPARRARELESVARDVRQR